MVKWVRFSMRDKKGLDEIIPGVSSGSFNGVNRLPYTGTWGDDAIRVEVNNLRKSGDKRLQKLADELEKTLK